MFLALTLTEIFCLDGDLKKYLHIPKRKTRIIGGKSCCACYGPGGISLSVLCSLSLFFPIRVGVLHLCSYVILLPLTCLSEWVLVSSQQLCGPAFSDVAPLDWAPRQCAANLNYCSARRSEGKIRFGSSKWFLACVLGLCRVR